MRQPSHIACAAFQCSTVTVGAVVVRLEPIERGEQRCQLERLHVHSPVHPFQPFIEFDFPARIAQAAQFIAVPLTFRPTFDIQPQRAGRTPAHLGHLRRGQPLM